MLNSFYKIEVILDHLLITFCEFISDSKNTIINSFKSLSSKSSIRPYFYTGTLCTIYCIIIHDVVAIYIYYK